MPIIQNHNAGVLRRATLLVRDLESSTAFYEQVFGLTLYTELDVDFDRVPAFPVGPEPRKGNSSFVILRGANPIAGMIGLMEVRDPPLDDPPYDVRRLGIGSIALVLSVADAENAARNVEELGGIILMPVTIARNLGDEDGGFVPVKMFMAQDLDGYFLEVFETLSGID